MEFFAIPHKQKKYNNYHNLSFDKCQYGQNLKAYLQKLNRLIK